MKAPIVVVAGNWKQFNAHMSDLASRAKEVSRGKEKPEWTLDGERYVFANRLSKLLGARPKAVWFIGTAYQLGDYEKMRERAKTLSA